MGQTLKNLKIIIIDNFTNFIFCNFFFEMLKIYSYYFLKDYIK